MHRTSKTPDWDKVEPSSRTLVQNIAASSRGLITPPNLISLVGLGLVTFGLFEITQDNIWGGLILLVVGRVLDLVDGAVAEATGTKSPVGEMVDATADKAATLLTFIVLITADLAPWWLIVALAAPQVAISLVVFLKRTKGVLIQPTRPGKLSMALVWISIVGLLATSTVETNYLLTTGVYAITAISIIIGLYTLWQYQHIKSK